MVTMTTTLQTFQSLILRNLLQQRELHEIFYASCNMILSLLISLCTHIKCLLHNINCSSLKKHLQTLVDGCVIPRSTIYLSWGYCVIYRFQHVT